MIYLFLIARVATEEEIIEVQTIGHHLEANGLDGAHAVECLRSFGACGSRFPNGGKINHQEHGQDSENESKAPVEFLSNRHC